MQIAAVNLDRAPRWPDFVDSDRVQQVLCLGEERTAGAVEGFAGKEGLQSEAAGDPVLGEGS